MLDINEIKNKKFPHKKMVKLYLIRKLNRLHIEVLGHYEGSLFELMYTNKLITWCWQTTESVIIFLNDNDYIERGYLHIDGNEKYPHSWICFNYKKIEYVLDPCLNIISLKDDYSKIFKTDVKVRILAKDVKDELVKLVNTIKKAKNLNKYEYEAIADGPKDINTPLYRNAAGYRGVLKDNKIKKLTVHYYYADC